MHWEQKKLVNFLPFYEYLLYLNCRYFSSKTPKNIKFLVITAYDKTVNLWKNP